MKKTLTNYLLINNRIFKMKTKHLLTGLVLPALLAACTAEEIVEQQAVVKNDLAMRPVVGKVTLSTGDVDSRATVGEGWNSLNFTKGDKIGARVMDVYTPYAGTSCDEDENCEVCTNPYWNYTIDNYFASSNYQYINDGAGEWNTDALMVEGNYMFYFPYNEEFLQRGPVKFTLPLKQNVLAVNENNQPVKDLFEGENPFLVAYNFLPAEGQDPTLGLDFQHVFAYPKITLKNTFEDADDDGKAKAITVDKIIITSKSNMIKNEGTIIHTGLRTALNNYLIDECENEYHAAVEAGKWVTLDENNRLKKETYKKFITNASVYPIVDFATGEESFITVDIEDVTLQPDETFSFYMVMPALQFPKDDLEMKVYLADNKMFKVAFAFETLNNYITFVPGKRYPKEEYNYSRDGIATPKTTAGTLSTFELEGEITDAVLPIKPISNIDEFEAMLDEVADNTDVLKEGTNAAVNNGEAQFSLATDKDGKVLLEIDDALMALLDEYLADGSIEFTSPMVVKASALDDIKFNKVTFASANLTIKDNVEASEVTIESGKVTVSNTANKALGTVTVNAGELVVAKANFLGNTNVVVAETLDEETGEQVAAGTLTINAANSLDNVAMEVDADVVINAAVTVDENNITAGTITNNNTITLAADWEIAEDVTFENKGKIAGTYNLNNEGTITTTKDLDVNENNGLIEVKNAAVTLNVISGEGEIDNTEAGMVSANTDNTVYAELDEITSLLDINKTYDKASGVEKIVATGTWTVRTYNELDQVNTKITDIEFKGASLSMASATLDLGTATVTIGANTTWTGRGAESIVTCGALEYAMYDANADNTDDTYYTLTVNKVVVKAGATSVEVDVNILALEQAATNGGAVTLTADVELDETISFGQTATLNLNGKTIVNKATNTDTDVIKVTAGTLTINGNGIIEAVSGNDGFTVFADGATAKVVINGGTFKVGSETSGNGNSCIYTKNGAKVEITGGYFESTGTPSTDFTPYQYSLLNEHDSNRGTIVVKGGTFKNFNPACNSSEGANTNFLATGYKVTGWNVSTNAAVAATTLTTYYDVNWSNIVEYTVVAVTE